MRRSDPIEAYHEIGRDAGLIFKGAAPGDLPVQAAEDLRTDHQPQCGGDAAGRCRNLLASIHSIT
jgi:hypothetical protein